MISALAPRAARLVRPLFPPLGLALVVVLALLVAAGCVLAFEFVVRTCDRGGVEPLGPMAVGFVAVVAIGAVLSRWRRAGKSLVLAGLALALGGASTILGLMAWFGLAIGANSILSESGRSVTGYLNDTTHPHALAYLLAMTSSVAIPAILGWVASRDPERSQDKVSVAASALRFSRMGLALALSLLDLCAAGAGYRWWNWGWASFVA